MTVPLEQRLRTYARQIGFDLFGIAAADAADGFDRYLTWLAAGYAGSMNYLHKNAEARRHPQSILPDVRSVVMVGLSYAPEADLSERANDPHTVSRAPTVGRVACYARGEDYHLVLWNRLKKLLDWLQLELPSCRGRAVADSAPLLERDFARRAGLGWIGKNTLLINRDTGSFVFLGALLIDRELHPDEPYEADHCGSCTACLDACPTQAFPSAGVLDARRCISYLTIENKGSVPEPLRGHLGDWIFGCDICQEVCPWNQGAPATREPALKSRPWLAKLDAAELLRLSEDSFRQRFGGTALMRAKRRGLLRNAALLLGNIGDRSALPSLVHALSDFEPIIREAAEWAIAEIERRHSAREEQSDVENPAPRLRERTDI